MGVAGARAQAPSEEMVKVAEETSLTEKRTLPETVQPQVEKRKKVSAAIEDGGFSPYWKGNVTSTAKEFLLDQKQIWTSPARLRFSDANWILPMSGLAAGMFVTDSDLSRHINLKPATVSHYGTISNASVGALIGGAGGMWLLSYPAHNPHWRETGFLAGAAVLNSFVVVEAMKYPLSRERPNEGNGNGQFLHGGVSFPSEHAAAAWAVAGVVAHEYPGPLTKIAVYSLASLVNYSRFRAHQHFPSDVFVGSLIGNLVAQDIYSRHHDSELGGEPWAYVGTYLKKRSMVSSSNMASPYVPLDSWIYPAMERLVAGGYIHSAILAMRPWTRFECARLVNEAGEAIDVGEFGSSDAVAIHRSLEKEFSYELNLMSGGENRTAEIESVYTRVGGISGAPLSQGYHYDFGQTVINDFGRPYGEGFNSVTGFSAWGNAGFFTAYVRGEYQHAPSAPPLSLGARELIGESQFIPVPPGVATSQFDRFELLDAYVAMNVENWQFSFGKQSLWWGPGEGGAMMFSDNAKPITMFRINRVSPFKLPSVLGWLGPMRVELFLGQLSGQNFLLSSVTGLVGNWNAAVDPQPMMDGARFSFKPTPNVEFGFSRTTLFAGEGVPFTTHTFLKSFFALNNANPGTARDAGDRRSGFDLTYRLPFLRNWATFYADGFTDDQFTPVAYWDRSAWSAGLYFSRIPFVPKLDLRVEGTYTDLPIGGNVSRGFFYWNDRYVNGYTNDGNLMGGWIGRQSQGAQAWSNYWFTPKSHLQFRFRHQKISQQFVPGGGSLTDVGAAGNVWIRPHVELGADVQYERWLIPVIQPNAARNVTASVSIRIEPKGWVQSVLKSGDSSNTQSGTGVRP